MGFSKNGNSCIDRRALVAPEMSAKTTQACPRSL